MRILPINDKYIYFDSRESVVEKSISHEFDIDRRIMHIFFPEKWEVNNRQELEKLFQINHRLFDKYKQFGRFYLVIGIGHLIIDPSLSSFYAQQASQLIEKFIAQGGVARYGYKITRVTVKKGYDETLKENPNLFGTREQAFAHIESLIAKVEAGEHQPVDKNH